MYHCWKIRWLHCSVGVGHKRIVKISNKCAPGANMYIVGLNINYPLIHYSITTVLSCITYGANIVQI